ncbi:1-aminocyclopropane-1-carboxylate synthase-like protein 1 [Colletotrichum trifolii]|uniref:1-aminocyclopropane-1-carboxylate synthase-like protein 1 n=1 Tax=Colletotrichum trifolii TaxID=5466 RepID=A0A4R8RTB2_COLTR|nr:1-aminocyclopropane-1-carboxylate synthase-like protein 1 [Colletotrichum trifolii]
MSSSYALPPSHRGTQSIQPDVMTEIRSRLEGDRYHPEKSPKGIIDLGSATNELMLEDLAKWTKCNLKKGEWKRGLGNNDAVCSPELLGSGADFMNDHFKVRIPLTPNNMLAANSTATVLDALIYSIADEGESILVPTPSSSIVLEQASARNNVSLVEVPCDDIPEERFAWSNPRDDKPTPKTTSPSPIVTRLEAAIVRELNGGRRVAGILLANPEEPIGRCYASHVLLQISQLCAAHKIHLVVDETYALSSVDSFHSMMSLGLDSNLSNVHVLWGMSKDFGLEGLSIGLLATYNGRIREAMRTSSTFGQVSSFSASVATKLLSDKKYLRNHYCITFNRRLKKRRILVKAELERRDIPFVKGNSGFFTLVDLSDWMDLLFAKHGRDGELDLLEYLMDNGVYLEPGATLSSKTPGHFRLSFGGDEHTLKTGIQRLFRCLRALDDKEEPFTSDDLAPYWPPHRHMAHLNIV